MAWSDTTGSALSVRNEFGRKGESGRTFAILLFAATISSALSLYFFFTPQAIPASHIVRPLLRPNPYARLSDLRAPLELLGPITSHAQVVLQVREPEGARVMYEDTTRSYFSHQGMIFPDDRHFVVNKYTSTIVQLRTVDSGMENCVLHAIPPNRTNWLNPAVTYTNQTEIVVWSLDTNHELNTPWAHVPRRTAMFGRFEAGQVWRSAPFSCSWGTFQTFEFSCGSESDQCYVEWWQDREGSNGVYMSQYDSTLNLEGLTIGR